MIQKSTDSVCVYKHVTYKATDVQKCLNANYTIIVHMYINELTVFVIINMIKQRVYKKCLNANYTIIVL